MKLSVSLGLWQDRSPEEALDTAPAAEAAGYPELWIGEMATWAAFALGTAISWISLTFGPPAVTVRDPATIAMGGSRRSSPAAYAELSHGGGIYNCHTVVTFKRRVSTPPARDWEAPGPALTCRSTGVALGTSSDVVARGRHSRSRRSLP